MQMDLRETLLDRAQQIFVIVDAQIGMQPALHENAGPAEGYGLFVFLKDGVEREDVASCRAEVAVERAEGAVLGVEIRVIDIAIDLVAGHARIVFLFAQLIRGHADADQVIGPEKIDRFLLREAHNQRLPCALPARWAGARRTGSRGRGEKSMGLSRGMRPAAAHSRYSSSRPSRFAASSEKSMLSRYHSRSRGG